MPPMPMSRSLLCVLLLAVALVPPSAHALQTTFVPLGSTWKYRDDGSNQGTAWRAPAFNDLGWPSGPAQLGYGDGDEATTVGFGPNASAKYVTTYFRRPFAVANAATYSTLTEKYAEAHLKRGETPSAVYDAKIEKN